MNALPLNIVGREPIIMHSPPQDKLFIRIIWQVFLVLEMQMQGIEFLEL